MFDRWFTLIGIVFGISSGGTACAAEKDCVTKLAATPGVFRCTLSSGDWSSSVTKDLAEGDLEDADSMDQARNDDFDLSFIAEATRGEETWTADITLVSTKIEDELTSFSFTWPHGARGEVGREVIDSSRTPDEREYVVTCSLE